MRIIAIDPGYERIGIAIIEKSERQEKLIYSSCFKTAASLPFPERLALIGKEVVRLIKEWGPKALAIETLVFNTNQKTAMHVAEARGAIIYEAVSQGLAVHEYTPLQVKIAITGYGRATKEQITAMLPKLITISPSNKPSSKKLDDEYDAIAIGLTHCATVKNK